jgi:hypothetical protein
MVQETAIAEGTNVMWSEEANNGITDLQQAGANIDNLQQACTSTSGSGGTKKRRYIKRKNKSKGTKRNKKNSKTKNTKKMRGGAFATPLMPPLFTNIDSFFSRFTSMFSKS